MKKILFTLIGVALLSIGVMSYSVLLTLIGGTVTIVGMIALFDELRKI
jgi:hypothetical protein